MGPRSQILCLLTLSSVLFHAVAPIAGSQTNTAEAASSSQPLWSYQVKPGYGSGSAGFQGPPGGGPYANGLGGSGLPSILDAFGGLSQRQGALGGSPLMSILPIILIAAGGMLLLLPLLTMAMASPFGGGPFGLGGGQFGPGGGFGFPQVAAKKRSLSQTNWLDIMEQVSSSVEDLARKYGGQQHSGKLKVFSQEAQTPASKPAVVRPNDNPPASDQLSAGGSGSIITSS